MHAVASQLKRHVVAIQGVAPEQRPNPVEQLPSKDQVFLWQLGVRNAAEAAFAVEAVERCSAGGRWNGALMSDASSRLLLQSMLMDFMCSHIPPMRLEALMSLLNATNGPTSTCADPNCIAVGCRGNRIERTDTLWPDDDSRFTMVHDGHTLYREDLRQMVIHILHHKNSWHDPPLTYTLPRYLSRALDQYLASAWPKLAGREGPPYLFTVPSGSGERLHHKNVEELWYALQDEWQAPWETFCPRLTRHIYSGHELSRIAHAVAVSAEHELQGDAMMMGNTVRMMRERYCASARQAMVSATLVKIDGWQMGVIQSKAALDSCVAGQARQLVAMSGASAVARAIRDAAPELAAMRGVEGVAAAALSAAVARLDVGALARVGETGAQMGMHVAAPEVAAHRAASVVGGTSGAMSDGDIVCVEEEAAPRPLSSDPEPSVEVVDSSGEDYMSCDESP